MRTLRQQPFLLPSLLARALLQGDYGFFRDISLWPPLVLIGIYATALSASMSSLIGASRILHALAQDDLFGVVPSGSAELLWACPPGSVSVPFRPRLMCLLCFCFYRCHLGTSQGGIWRG